MVPLLHKLMVLLGGERADVKAGDPLDLQTAVAALLVEAARRDDVFAPAERASIERILAEHFELSPAETRELFDAAAHASKTSLQLFGFTRTIMTQMEDGERIKLIEMLWDVVYADGVIDPHEDALVRRVAGLIHVSDFERGAARRRVRERRGFGPDTAS